MYPRNAASPPRIAVGAVVQIADGAVQGSGVSIAVVPEGGASGAGGGTTAYDNGIVLYTPTQAETNYTAFVVIAYKTGCIPVQQTIVTSASSTAGYVKADNVIGAPTLYSPSTATRTVGDNDGGTVSNLASHDDSAFSTGEVVGSGLDVLIVRSASTTTETPSVVRVSGYYSGTSTHEIGVYLWNYLLAVPAWEQVGTMRSRSSTFDYSFPMSAGNAKAADGEMKIRFLHNTVSPYVASHSLILDFVSFEKIGTTSSLASDVAAIYSLLQDVDTEVDNMADNGVALTASERNSVADALLKRDFSSVTGEAARSMLNALRFLRNKWAITTGTLSVKKEDDSTEAWNAAVTAAPGADPISGSDPS